MKPSMVAIIPARGGSKRIPRKNIRDFGGKPMIAWTIEAALESGLFDDVIVSTDDELVAEIARQHGAKTPFLRPAEISDDRSGLNVVLRHALQWLAAHGQKPAWLACLYATAPFLCAEDLRAAAAALQTNPAAEYILSVCAFPAPVQRAMTTDAEGKIHFLWPELRLAASQDLAPAFHDAGQFVIGRTEAFLTQDSALSGHCLPHIIPRHRCQDIDTLEDWEHAMHLLNALSKSRPTTVK